MPVLESEKNKKKGGRFPCPPAESGSLVHFVHFFAATFRSRLVGLHGLISVALDANVTLVFLRLRRLGRGFAAARTTAHIVLLLKFKMNYTTLTLNLETVIPPGRTQILLQPANPAP